MSSYNSHMEVLSREGRIKDYFEHAYKIKRDANETIRDLILGEESSKYSVTYDRCVGISSMSIFDLVKLLQEEKKIQALEKKSK